MCSFLCPGVRHSRCFGSVRTLFGELFFPNQHWNLQKILKYLFKKKMLQKKT